MKKALSLLMCYAIGMGAFISDAFGGVVSSIDFNNERLFGKHPAFGLDDYGNTNSINGTYWYYPIGFEDGSTIRRYHDGKEPGTKVEDKYDGFNDSNLRPEYMSLPANNAGVLEVAANELLQRTLVSITSSDGPTRDDCVEIPAAGLYLDQQVSFTVIEGTRDAGVFAAAGNKLSYFIASDDIGSTTGRLMIAASRIDENGDLVPTLYKTTMDQMVAGKWYRVSLRAIGNAATTEGPEFPAFAMYIDGQLVTCAEGEYPLDDKSGRALFRGNGYFEGRSLFPSMQPVGGVRYAQKIYSVAMQGAGRFDELGVTDENLFPTKTNQIDLIVLCDEGSMRSLAYKAEDADGVYAEDTIDSGIDGFRIPARVGATITLVPTGPEGSGFADEVKISGNVEAVVAVTNFVLTFAKEFNDAGSVTCAFRQKDMCFRVGSKIFASFWEAMDAVGNSGATVYLQADINLETDALGDNGQARVLPNQNAVLDLMGHTIKGRHFDDEAAIYNQGQLTIIDSEGGGTIEAAGTAIEIVRDNTALDNHHKLAKMTIGEDYSEDFTIKGRVKNTSGELVVKKGLYLNPSDQPTATFYLKEYLPDNRYSATSEMQGSDLYFRVSKSSQCVVKFVSEVGEVKTPSVRVEDQAELKAPSEVDAPGYTITGWLYQGEKCEFPLTVTSDMTLVAAYETNVYTIVVSPETAGIPTEYTVVSDYVELPKLADKPLFAFVGWRDGGSDEMVTAVGKGATFASGKPVIGKLNLYAVWQTTELKWENTAHQLFESNGTYAGTWPFVIPASKTLPLGTRVKIDEIAFCVVNPTTYEKTSEYLAVQPAASSVAIVSDMRQIPEKDESGAYVGVETLANGRAKVGYRFDLHSLTLTVGETNQVFFSNSEGLLTEGFLRLSQIENEVLDRDYMVIGTCDPNYSGEESYRPCESYGSFVPTYEIKGGAVNE